MPPLSLFSRGGSEGEPAPQTPRGSGGSPGGSGLCSSGRCAPNPITPCLSLQSGTGRNQVTRGGSERRLPTTLLSPPLSPSHTRTRTRVSPASRKRPTPSCGTHSTCFLLSVPLSLYLSVPPSLCPSVPLSPSLSLPCFSPSPLTMITWLPTHVNPCVYLTYFRN